MRSTWVRSGAGRVPTERSSDRRRQLQGRLALIAGALALAAGIVVYFQFRAGGQPAPTTRPAVAKTQTNPYVQPDLKPGGTLPAAAKHVAARFVLTALARRNLAEAWQIVTPGFRVGVTRAQWLRGELPVPPFPVSGLEAAGFSVQGTTGNKIYLQIFLVPDPDSGLTPTRYNMTLVHADGAWKVSYAQPYAPPGVYARPD